MDCKRKISTNLGDYIITNISNIAQNGNKDNHTVIIKSIDLLYSFLDEKEQLSFVVSSAEKKKSYIELCLISVLIVSKIILRKD